jgi:hypothetical protein
MTMDGASFNKRSVRFNVRLFRRHGCWSALRGTLPSTGHHGEPGTAAYAGLLPDPDYGCRSSHFTEGITLFHCGSEL